MARAATRPANAPAEPEDDKPTKRIVLRREQVIILPDDLPEETLKALPKILADAVKDAKALDFQTRGDAWIVVGEFEGKSKTQAIEAHAGKPGTPDAKPGAYKAPTVTAFAGGSIYERPSEPKVERKALD